MSTLHSNEESSNKRQKTSCHVTESGNEQDEDSQTSTRHPRSFVTWNCNGLTSRCTWNVTDLELLLSQNNHPDMICMQEVRLAATGSIGRQRGIPKNDARNYRGPVHDVLTNVFGDYIPFWSLADTKYAGTLTLIHQRCLLATSSKNETAAAASNSTSSYSNSFNDFAAFTPKSAIDLILRRLGKTRQDCGLSSPLLASNKMKQTLSSQLPASKMKQTNMSSFFAPKPSEKSASSCSSSSNKNKSLVNNCNDHDTEGRFQFFFFPDMDVVHTYVPNNGTNEKSFQKRRDWDEELLQFWKDRRQVLNSCSNSGSASNGIDLKNRKLMWCGDMNVARDYRDGTHWEERRGPKFNSSSSNSNSSSNSVIYEWWTDESKCLVQGNNNIPTKNKKPENVGMPSFTPAERSRFNEMLQQGDFCDAWRELHPNAGTVSCTNAWDLPNYTWRGALAKKESSPPSKYQGKGQRLDYFLLSPANGFSVESCEILGNGSGREGLFCGSDHCAVSLKI